MKFYVVSILTAAILILPEIDGTHNFDFFLFTQVWPVSGCIEWEDRSDENTCTIKDSNLWTVHGIWPTKEHEVGPLFCNKSIRFDEDQLTPILDELRLRWTNVRANTVEDSFWKHEWLKHGSCAIQIQSLDSELKYFSKGLELNRKFPMARYLADSGLQPGGVYNSRDVLDAVKAETGKYPALECDTVDEYPEPVLTQIGICLDKSLNVIGCEDTAGGLWGRCPKNGKVVYPSIPRHSGKDGIIFGTILGLLIISVAVIFFARRYWLSRREYSSYESI